MIFCSASELQPLLKRLAPLLSPTGKFKRNDIARQWTFDKSSWIASEKLETSSHEIVGFALTSLECDAARIAFIENAVSLLLNLGPEVWTTMDERWWGEEVVSKKYDCGYETEHQFGRDMLKITIQHQGSYYDRKPTAVAKIKKPVGMDGDSSAILRASKSEAEVKWNIEPVTQWVAHLTRICFTKTNGIYSRRQCEY